MLRLESQTLGNNNSSSKDLLSFHASDSAVYLTFIISFDVHSYPSGWFFITILQMGKVRLRVKVSDSPSQGVVMLGLWEFFRA